MELAGDLAAVRGGADDLESVAARIKPGILAPSSHLMVPLPRVYASPKEANPASDQTHIFAVRDPQSMMSGAAGPLFCRYQRWLVQYHPGCLLTQSHNDLGSARRHHACRAADGVGQCHATGSGSDPIRGRSGPANRFTPRERDSRSVGHARRRRRSDTLTGQRTFL